MVIRKIDTVGHSVDVAVPSKTFVNAPGGAWVGPGMYFTRHCVLCCHELQGTEIPIH